MSLKIPPAGGLDLLSLGALVHRLDPGIIPFRKASQCAIHVSGGEFNVAANLSDCFRVNAGVANGSSVPPSHSCRATSSSVAPSCTIAIAERPR